MKNVEDKAVLSAIERIFIQKRKWVHKMPKKGENVILLISGGLDSICLWNLLLDKFKLNIYPIYFRNSKKKSTGAEESISYFSGLFQKKYPNLFHQTYIKYFQSDFSFSNVKDKNKILWNIPDIINNLIYFPKYDLYIPTLINNPSRLGMYAFGAYEYSYKLKYEHDIETNNIFIGIVPEDAERLRESTLTVLRSINLVLCLIMGNFKWQFTAPIDKNYGFYYLKQDLISYAMKCNLPLERTWSCTRSDCKEHCGYCFNCLMRRISFEKAGFEDKTSYHQKQGGLRKKLILSRRINNIVNKTRNFLNNSRVTKLKDEEITDSTNISLNSGIVSYEIKEKIIILNKHKGYIEELNKTATLIWKKIAEKQITFSQLLSVLEMKYNNADIKTIRNDLFKFLKKYEASGYLILRH